MVRFPFSVKRKVNEIDKRMSRSKVKVGNICTDFMNTPFSSCMMSHCVLLQPFPTGENRSAPEQYLNSDETILGSKTS